MTNLSIIHSVVVLLAILVTGLLAGVMLGVAMEQQTAQKLPEAAWTLRQQNDDALFRKVMPFTFAAMMLLLIASIFLLHGSSRMAMVVATVAAIGVIIVTARWEVPMNNEIVKWIAGNAPADYRRHPPPILPLHSVRESTSARSSLLRVPSAFHELIAGERVKAAARMPTPPSVIRYLPRRRRLRQAFTSTVGLRPGKAAVVRPPLSVGDGLPL